MTPLFRRSSRRHSARESLSRDTAAVPEAAALPAGDRDPAEPGQDTPVVSSPAPAPAESAASAEAAGNSATPAQQAPQAGASGVAAHGASETAAVQHGTESDSSGAEAEEHPAPLPAPQREDLVSRAYAAWQEELAARAERAAENVAARVCIDLTHPHPTGGAQFSSGAPTRLTSLIREERSQQEALATWRTLRDQVARAAEEYGYAPIQLASGNLTWTELPPRRPSDELEPGYEDTGELKLDPEAMRACAEKAAGQSTAQTSPADNTAAQAAAPNSEETRQVREVSVPIVYRLLQVEDVGTDALIQTTPALSVNPDIVSALRQHGAPVRELAQLTRVERATEDELITRVRRLSHLYLPGASYRPQVLLGMFADPAARAITDAELLRPVMIRSGVLAAIAGDRGTHQLTSAPLPPAEKRDRAPEGERGVGDLDVAELAAVEAVATGRDVVIDTPPGSADVTTLVAIAADAAASSRSVLYIPGTRARRAAVTARAGELGVGELLIDLSGINGAALRLRQGLRQKFPQIDEERTLAVRRDLKAARRSLRGYVNALHAVDPVWNTSVYDVLEHLAELAAQPQGPATKVRLDATAAARVREDREAVLERLAEASRAGAFSGGGNSEWLRAQVRTEDDAARAFSTVTRMATETLPLVMEQSQRVAGETGLARPKTLAQWMEQIKMLEGIADTLEVFKPAVYERSVADMVIATASDEWRAEHGESMKRAQRRALTKQARDFVRPGIRVADMHAALSEVARQRDIWRRYSAESDWPTLPEGMTMIRATAAEVDGQVRELEEFLPHRAGLRREPIENVLALVRTLVSQRRVLDSQPRRIDLLHDLEDSGLGDFARDMARREVSGEAVAAELDLAYTNSVFEQLIARNTVLAQAGPQQLAMLVHTVRDLDREHVESLPGPVLRAAITHMQSVARKQREETVAVDRYLARAGVSALADVAASATALVQAARPVWVVPPALVPELIPTLPWADVVILDGIEDVPLAAVVALMARGSQLVVLGEVARAGADSALAALADALPVCELPTFRAHHDDLALACLRTLGYDDADRAAPAGRVRRADRLQVVDGRGVPSPNTGMVEAPSAEVDAVVDAVVDHLLTRPEESLAVITISRLHAVHVRAAVERTIANSPALAEAGESAASLVPVVDITGASGLRRDRVIFSVGFGKTVHGRVLHTFGPLTEAEGARYLSEALLVPSRYMSVISSLGPGDIGVDDLSGAAPRLLATLLETAAREELLIGADEDVAKASPLLFDLAARLRGRGLFTALYYGYDAGLRIPLVVAEHEGDWRVAVLTDDADYVAEPSLRRRDRYRVEMLEDLGWKVVQTFSSSIFLDPEAEADRIEALVRVVRRDEAAARHRAEDTPAFGADVADVADEADVAAAGAGSDAGASGAPGAGMPGVADAESTEGAEAQQGEAGADNSSGTHTPAPGNAAGSAQAGTSAPDPEVSRRARGKKPAVRPGLPLAAYSDDQLDDMVAWIASDGVARSSEQLVEELRSELDIRRRGPQADAVLGNVVRRSGLAQD
ncbi:hypothetical protein QP315_05815 [Actinotignum timonense]|uniref:hypothetical protein n=1 Tax=Actinotignum timonense TaxID=1870995 RepID=UPI00254C2DC2|nr:hypothetical protein [Actinotignum timonense]MDK6906738.1 hypothetical protein [Actinotignum timonense]